MPGLVRAGLVVALLTLAGRLAGMGRELALATTMGVGSNADVAVLLFALPDLLTQVLAAGAITAVLIPVFQAAHPDTAVSLALFRKFSGWALLFGTLMALILWAGSDAVVTLLAPGFAAMPRTQAITGIAVVAWTLPLTVATAVSSSWLQSESRFAVVTLGTLLFNLVVIAVLLGWPGSLTIFSVGIVLGAGARWLSQILALRPFQSGSMPCPALPEGLWRRYAEAGLAASVIFAAPLIARSLASLEGSGGVATLNYATRVLEVPMGLAFGVIPIILFPRLVSSRLLGDQKGFVQLVALGLLILSALTVPVALSLAAFGDVAARLVYSLAGLDAKELSDIGRLVSISAVGLPALGAAFMLQNALHARLDTRGPIRASVVYVVVLILGGVIAVRLSGLETLTAVLVLGQWVYAGALLMRLRTAHQVSPLSSASLTTIALLVLAASTVLVLPVWLTLGSTDVLRRLIAACVGGSASVLAALLVVRGRTREIRLFYRPFAK